jgi:hypothetical protein
MSLEVPVLDEPMREESGVVHMQDVPAQAEMVTIDEPLGNDGAHVEVPEPQPSGAAAGEALGLVPPRGIYLDLVVCSPGPSLPGDLFPGEAVQAP